MIPIFDKNSNRERKTNVRHLSSLIFTKSCHFLYVTASSGSFLVKLKSMQEDLRESDRVKWKRVRFGGIVVQSRKNAPTKHDGTPCVSEPDWQRLTLNRGLCNRPSRSVSFSIYIIHLKHVHLRDNHSIRALLAKNDTVKAGDEWNV